MTNLFVQMAAIMIAIMVAQWSAWKLHIPAIVFLLLLGFLLGPVSGIVQPDILLGDLLSPVVSVAVAIILFEGGLNLHFREIREMRRAVRHIVLFGAPLGWFLLSLGVHYIAGLSWPVSITFAGILVVTGPTVIMPMLRHARLNQRISPVLKWEGIINDPVGVIFAVLAYEYFHFHQVTPESSDQQFVIHYLTVLLAVGIGSYVAGRISAFILESGQMPEFLKAPFLFSGVISLFAVCNLFLHESGLIAVTVYGMTLANVHVASIEEIRRFKETITLLLVSAVFILLTADLDPSVLLSIDWRGGLFIAAVIFLIRPLTIFFASLGTGLTWKERLLVGWIAPRGIVCAAIAGVIGPSLVEAGFPDGERIMPLAFGIVISTVVLHSLTLKPLARFLELGSSGSNGLIIVGSSEWTIQLAKVLIKHDVPVIITDTVLDHLKKARIAEVPVYYGEILSSETEYNLELNKYRTLLAATDNSAYNMLVCNSFAHDLGRNHVYQISFEDEGDAEHKRLPGAMGGRVFGDAGMDYVEWLHYFFDNERFYTVPYDPEKQESHKKIEADKRLIGVIGKTGTLVLNAPDKDMALREGDLLILFSNMEEAS